MDKSLGTLLHFWGVFQFTQAQPLPSPHKQCWMRVSRIFFGFQLCIGWGEGELQENFKKDALFYEGTQKQGCQKVFRLSRLVMNSIGGFGTWIKATCSWGPRHLGTFWNLEPPKWHFQWFSRGIFHHRHNVFSSEYTQDWEQCRWNAPGVPRHRTVHTFNRAKPFQIIYAFNFIRWCSFFVSSYGRRRWK